MVDVRVKKSKVLEFVKKSLESEGEYHEINFGNVPNFQAQQIVGSTGIKIHSAIKILSSYAVLHIFKSHGNDSKNKNRSQKSITNEDFELIGSILESPDSIVYSGKNTKQKDCLMYSKIIGGFNYRLVMSVCYSKNRDTGKLEVKLFVNTMYVKK